MHRFLKRTGLTEQQFYNRYNSPEAFFAEYPEMAEGGYVGAGVLPDVMPGMYPGNQPTLMNQKATVPMDIPAYKNGGKFFQRPGYFYNGEHMIKTPGSGTYEDGTYFEQGGYSNPLNRPWDTFKNGGYAQPLDIPFDNFEKGGKIHIKKENRGKFNATKKATGKTTEELTHSSNPVTRKRAIFAQNFGGNKKEYGGYVKGSQHELEDAEIQSLIAQGYKIKYV